MENTKNKKQCSIHDVRQRCVEFAEWCMKNKYTYYFNGETWMWANAKKQEYYTTEELYNKCFNNNVIIEQPIDGSQITEVPFEEQKYVEITSEEQLREYNGCKFKADMFVDQIESHIEGVVFNKDVTTLILHNNEYAGWKNHQIYQDLYNYCWSVFDDDFGTRIKSLKILL